MRCSLHGQTPGLLWYVRSSHHSELQLQSRLEIVMMPTLWNFGCRICCQPDVKSTFPCPCRRGTRRLQGPTVRDRDPVGIFQGREGCSLVLSSLARWWSTWLQLKRTANPPRSPFARTSCSRPVSLCLSLFLSSSDWLWHISDFLTCTLVNHI